jgi:hypothetical protein
MSYLEFLRLLADARAAYSTRGVAGASSEIKRLFDAYDSLRSRNYLTPPPA